MDDTGLPYRFEAAFCLPPAIAALLTGKPQLSLTVKSQNERTVLIEHTDYPNGISHTCIIPADGPAPRDVA